MSATKLKEKRDAEEEAENYYADDFEDDSEEEVNNFNKTDQIVAPWCKRVVVRPGSTRIFCIFLVCHVK